MTIDFLAAPIHRAMRSQRVHLCPHEPASAEPPTSSQPNPAEPFSQPPAKPSAEPASSQPAAQPLAGARLDVPRHIRGSEAVAEWVVSVCDVAVGQHGAQQCVLLRHLQKPDGSGNLGRGVGGLLPGVGRGQRPQRHRPRIQRPVLRLRQLQLRGGRRGHLQLHDRHRLLVHPPDLHPLGRCVVVAAASIIQPSSQPAAASQPSSESVAAPQPVPSEPAS